MIRSEWATMRGVYNHWIWKRIFRNCRNLGDSQLGAVGIRWGGDNIIMIIHKLALAVHGALTSFDAIPPLQFHNAGWQVSKYNTQIAQLSFPNAVGKFQNIVLTVDRAKTCEPSYFDIVGRCIYQPFWCEQKGANVWTHHHI